MLNILPWEENSYDAIAKLALLLLPLEVLARFAEPFQAHNLVPDTNNFSRIIVCV
jgi:hypothetical protein